MEPARPQSTPPQSTPQSTKPHCMDKKDGVAETGTLSSPSVPEESSSWLGWLIRGIFVKPVTKLLYATGIMHRPEQSARKVLDVTLSNPVKEKPLEKKLKQHGNGHAFKREDIPAALNAQRLQLSAHTVGYQRQQLERALKKRGMLEGAAKEEAQKALKSHPLSVLDEDPSLSLSRPVTDPATDKTGFAGASFKALLSSYPTEFFEAHLAQTFPDLTQEAVSKAFTAVLGAMLQGENATGQLKAFYHACQDYYQAHQIKDGVLSKIFNDAGEVEGAVNVQRFISELMSILELGDKPQVAGTQLDYSVIDEHKWGSPLPECLAIGAPLNTGQKRSLTAPLVLQVTPGDGSQTIQSCLDRMFEPTLPGSESTHLKASKQELQKMGYKAGSDPVLDEKLSKLGDGEQLEFPVEVAKQPRLSVDLGEFRTFAVSLDVFNPQGTELNLPEEAATITRDSGEFITLPVTDKKTGLHYLVRMRQKSACVYDEQSGQYKASIRKKNKWECHDSKGKDPSSYNSCWNMKKPHIAHVVFYELEGEPIPVPSAKFVSLDQNQVDPEKLPDNQKQIALQVKEWTGHFPRLFRSSDEDILLSDIDLPGSGDSQPASGTSAALFNQLRQEKYKGKSLVENPAEFIALFSAVPVKQRKDHKVMVSAMKSYRDFQADDPDKYVFPPASFAPLLAKGMLVAAKVEVSDLLASERELLEKETRQNQVKNAFGYVQDQIDLPVIDKTPQELSAAGIAVHGSGLWNFNNNCFMNAPLQMMAHSFKLAGNLEQFKQQKIPFSVARELIERKFPRQTQEEQGQEETAKRRAEKIDAATHAAMNGEGKYAIRVKGFKKFYDFRNSFVAMMEALTDGRVHPELPDLQREFYRTYLDISRDSNKIVASMIMGERKPEEIVPQAMVQQDPTEFINDIYALLGLDRDPEACIVDISTQKMVYNGQVVLSRSPEVPEPLAIVPMPLTGVKAPTIPGMIERYCTEHDLPGEERVDWSGDDCANAGVPVKDKSLCDTRQINQFTIMGDRPPRRLMITAKMFDYATEKYPVRQVMNEKGEIEDKFMKPGPFKPVLEGDALAANTDVSGTISIPFIRPAAPLVSMSPGSTSMVEDYSIKSIVCHGGDSCIGGHYITIKFEKGQTLICNDSRIIDLQDMHKFEGHDQPYENWQDFCKRQRFQPYIFSLEASDPELDDEYEDAVDTLPPKPLEEALPLVAAEEDALSETSSDFASSAGNIASDVTETTPESSLTISASPLSSLSTIMAPQSGVKGTVSNSGVGPGFTKTDMDTLVLIDPPEGAPWPVSMGNVQVVSGDICQLYEQWGVVVEAMANPVNEKLERVDGISDAFFDAVGEEADQLKKDCRVLGRCPAGEVRTTRSYGIPSSPKADYIIHAAGPDMHQKQYKNNPALAKEKLKEAYLAVMEEADYQGLKSVAIPVIGAGILGFDPNESAKVAAQAVYEYQYIHEGRPEVVFVAYHDGKSRVGADTRSSFINEMESLTNGYPVAGNAKSKVKSTPPILLSHCLKEAENSVNVGARINYALYKALSSAPLDSHKPEREGWGAWAYRLAFTTDNYHLPKRLLTDPVEFVQLFKSVSVENRNNPEYMVDALQNFRKLQQMSPSITPAMFSLMLARGTLDEMPEDDADDLVDDIQSTSNMPLVDTSRASVGRMKPEKFYPGLDNPSVDSAFKAALHMMAKSFASPDVLQALREQETPRPLARMMVAEAYKKANGFETISDDDLDKEYKAVEEGSSDLAAELSGFMAYRNFVQDFASLMEEMNTKVPGDSLDNMFSDFITSYSALCEATGKPFPPILHELSDILEDGDSRWSADALMTELMSYLDANNNAACALKCTENYILPGKTQRQGEVIQQSSIPLPVPHRLMTSDPSLQRMLLDSCERLEMLPGTAAHVWSELELKDVQGEQRNGVKTLRSVTYECMGNKPPERLMFDIQPKNSGGFYTSKTDGLPANTYAEDMGQALRNTEPEVSMCIPMKRGDGKVAVVDYKLQDIVCKRPSSEGHDHYVTLQFRGDKMLICDGAVSVELKDYVRSDGSKPQFKTWWDFCSEEGLEVGSVAFALNPVTKELEHWRQKGYQMVVYEARNAHNKSVIAAHEKQDELRKIEEEERAKLELKRKEQKTLAAMKGRIVPGDADHPIQIELVKPEPVSRTEKPGFDNLGASCYANSALVCLIRGLSEKQLASIEGRIKDMPLEEQKVVAKGFLNLARAFNAGASDGDVDFHLKSLFRACHFLGEAEKKAVEAGKLKDNNPVFIDFFPSAKRYNKSMQDSQEYLNKLMDVLGLRTDPTCCVFEQSEFVTDIGGVKLRKPEYSDPSNSKPKEHSMLSVPVLSQEEMETEGLARMTGLTVSELCQSYDRDEPEAPSGLQELMEGVSRAEEMGEQQGNAIRWELEGFKSAGNYAEVVKAIPRIDEFFNDYYERGDVICMNPASSTKQVVYSADLEQLETLMMHYKIFDNQMKKRTERCRFLKKEFPGDVTVKIRNTVDGKDYDVLLRPVSVSGHSGGASIQGGHFIGYTYDEKRKRWITHNDSSVSASSSGLKGASADPYLVNYKVLSKTLSEEELEIDEAMSLKLQPPPEPTEALKEYRKMMSVGVERTGEVQKPVDTAGSDDQSKGPLRPPAPPPLPPEKQ